MNLRQLFEAPGKTAVAAFGRMNPPTIGHAKLVDKIKSIPGDHFLFLSQTQNAKDNPLSFDQKIRFAKASFNDITIGNPTVRTPIDMMQQLEQLGYTDVVYIAGSDRVSSFEGLLNKYNGKDYNFNSIKVVSAGERDPDADGAEGMSASKMRKAAIEGDFDSFKQGVANPQIATEMYDAIRDAMGIKNEIMSFGIKRSPKRATIKKKPEKFDDPGIRDRIAARRKAAASGDKDAWKSSILKTTSESDVVLDKTSVRNYIRDLIIDYLEKEDDVEKLSKILKTLVGKQVKSRGSRYQITAEDILEAMKRG